MGLGCCKTSVLLLISFRSGSKPTLHYLCNWAIKKKPSSTNNLGNRSSHAWMRDYIYIFFCIFIQFRIPNLPPTGLSFFAQSNQIIKNHTNAQDTVLSKQLHTNNCFRSLILIATCSNKGFAVFVTALSLKCGNFFLEKSLEIHR